MIDLGSCEFSEPINRLQPEPAEPVRDNESEPQYDEFQNLLAEDRVDFDRWSDELLNNVVEPVRPSTDVARLRTNIHKSPYGFFLCNMPP